jgi:predicted Zn finger-like uncharacterized protein
MAYDSGMKVHCPSCHAEFVISDEEHYRNVLCPTCGNEFQAVSAATEQVGRDYLDEILRDVKPKPK